MAAISVTTGYPKVFSLGDKMMYIWQSTDVDDADTLATGLGTRIIDYWVKWEGNPTTQTSGGGHSVRSGATISLYPGENNLGVSVFAIADGS